VNHCLKCCTLTQKWALCII